MKFGGIGKEEQTLTLSNVDKTDRGECKCVAPSHINAVDEKSIEIIVRLICEYISDTKQAL